MLHIRIDIQQRAQENVSISGLCVGLGDGTVEAVLSCHGKSETMYEKLAFLLVALRGITLQTVRYIAEVRLPCPVVG